VLGHASSAGAQSRTGFAVNRFEPAERGSAYFVLDSLDFRQRLHPAIGATVDYAYKPLVVEDTSGVERFALVRRQLFVHVGASLAVAGRVRLGLDVPLAVFQDGEGGVVAAESLKAATAPALGDVRFAADVRVLGSRGDPFVVAVGVRAWAPTGLRSQFTSDGSARASPQVLASGDLGIVGWAARVAVVYRSRDDDYAGSDLGSELLGAAGAGLRLANGRLFLGPELWTTSVFTGGHLFGTRETPASAIFGAHYDIGPVRMGAGIGSGLGQGYGSPRTRAVLSIEWAPAYVPPIADSDEDGISDVDDACPNVAGVRDSDPVVNGCPRLPPIPPEDADRDGVADTDDACPAIAGVRTMDPMTNGCPASTAPRPLAVVTKDEIRIGEQIRFATDSADLLADSDAVLSAVKRLLDERGDIRKLRIEGHTDSMGDPAYNDDLSARRAAAVTSWLTQHGIDASRLESKGFGSRRSIDRNDTEAGRANNRRVVFTILERVTPNP
jgi:OmpA-OmpF porin, OOP family